MKLFECIRPLFVKEVVNINELNSDFLNIEIKDIAYNSLEVTQGSIFVALRGRLDGYDFINEAISKGAVAVLVEKDFFCKAVPVIKVRDTRRALAIIASHFYGYPTTKLKVIGVTGTNGKTTTTNLIYRIFNDYGLKTGMLGTLGVYFDSNYYSLKNTTPESLDLQRYFSLMEKSGCSFCIMEVSSHALHMGRTRGCKFNVGIFTNLTHEHLDYHGNMENYCLAKSLLFSHLGSGYLKDEHKVAILNIDDPFSSYMKDVTPVEVITYGLSNSADVFASSLNMTVEGVSFVLHTFLGTIAINTKLVGIFNVYNVLAACCVALVKGIPLEKIKESLANFKGVKGRMQVLENFGQPFTVIIDYAHTPDALENVLKTIRDFAKGRIICVIGSGGERDKEKRPKLANIAVKYSDFSIFTSDNPRSEEPEAIIKDMEKGVTKGKRYLVIFDRYEAIEYALSSARENDVVLIAGKGHEEVQVINGKSLPFSDFKVAKDILKQKFGG